MRRHRRCKSQQWLVSPSSDNLSMKCRFFFFLWVVVWSWVTLPLANAALIVNGGFEDPVTNDGPPFVAVLGGLSLRPGHRNGRTNRPALEHRALSWR